MAKKQKIKINKRKEKNWYSNRYQMVVVQRNIALLLTAMCMICVTLSLMYIKYITAHKALEPYVIEIDTKSGMPTVVERRDSNSFTEDETIKKYFVNQYLNAAEGYNNRTFKEDYEKLRLMSSQNVYNYFKGRLSPRNSTSPISQMGTRGSIRAVIKTLKFTADASGTTTAKIRMKVNASGRIGEIVPEKNIIINMSFIFSDMKLEMKDRMLNPLGFQVISYTMDEEIF